MRPFLLIPNKWSDVPSLFRPRLHADHSHSATPDDHIVLERIRFPRFRLVALTKSTYWI